MGSQFVDFNADGHLDCSQLREIVFQDPQARQRLEAILHPRIRATMLMRAEQSPAPYVVFVIPLLFETGQQALVDRILLIDMPEALQRARVAARDSLSNDEIDRIMAAQVDRETRRLNADDIVCNDGTIAELRAEIEKLHRKYLQQIE